MKIPGATYPEGAEVREDGAIRFYNPQWDRVEWRKPVPGPEGKHYWDLVPEELQAAEPPEGE